MSATQLAIWSAQQLWPDVAFTIALYLEMDRFPDYARLSSAARTAGARFGSTYVRLQRVEGQPVFVPDRAANDNIEIVDFRGSVAAADQANEWMARDCRTPLDMERDPLLRLALLRVSETNTLFYIRGHHVLLDGYGACNLISEIARLYSLDHLPDGELPIDYAGFAVIHDFEETYRRSRRSREDAIYWRNTLSEGCVPPDLRGDRKKTPPSHASTRTLTFSTDVTDRTSRLLAAFTTFLARVTARPEITLSLPVSARTTAALKRTGGAVSNVLPLRLSAPDTDTIGALTTRIASVVAASLRHQLFRRWSEVADASDNRGLAADFGPVVNFLDFLAPLEFSGMRTTCQVLTTGPIADVAINVYPNLDEDGVRVDFAWNSHRYDAEQIDRYTALLQSTLRFFLEQDPSAVVADLDLLDEVDRDLVLRRWNDTTRDIECATLADVLDDRVARFGDAVAVVTEGRQLTYRDLDVRANRLARQLISLGVGPETSVAVAIERSLDLVVALWAVLKAGGVYVPLDLDHPSERIRVLVETTDSQCVLVAGADSVPTGIGARPVIDVGGMSGATWSPEPVTDAERRIPLRPDNTAYVMFTSGSTGTPKGVAVPHRGLPNFCAEQGHRYAVTSESRVLFGATTTFDASMLEVLLALSGGAAMVVAPVRIFAGGHLAAFLEAERITHAFLTTAVVATIEAPAVSSLEVLAFGGEACPPNIVDRWAGQVRMHQGYGPTETSMMVTISGPLTQGDSVTIGAPIRNTRAWVLDG
ncbi:AMP-binding protein, partial [Nocardia sp. R7R-8]|uniref:AMP-binding protein n=1 Tax=Nocardia sp. R7R-8 TaxID=3459304 RepID=UPI00403E253C